MDELLLFVLALLESGIVTVSWANAKGIKHVGRLTGIDVDKVVVPWSWNHLTKLQSRYREVLVLNVDNLRFYSSGHDKWITTYRGSQKLVISQPGLLDGGETIMLMPMKADNLTRISLVPGVTPDQITGKPSDPVAKMRELRARLGLSD